MKKALFLLVSLSVANLGFGFGAYVKNNTDKYACFRVEYGHPPPFNKFIPSLKHDYQPIVPPMESRYDDGELLDYSKNVKAWVYLGDDIPATFDWKDSRWQLAGELDEYTANADQNWGLFIREDGGGNGYHLRKLVNVENRLGYKAVYQ